MMTGESTAKSNWVVHKEMRKHQGMTKDGKHVQTVEPLCGAPGNSGECYISFYWQEVTCRRCRKLRTMCDMTVH